MGDLIDPQVLKACLFYGLGQLFAFFQCHAQFFWKWWDGRPILAVLVFGIPAGISFWYATKVAFLAMDEVWGPRFLGFCISYVTFPILAWYLMNESMLTTKTLLCVLLSFCIISIQLFWKT
jgi:hypothetical protein